MPGDRDQPRHQFRQALAQQRFAAGEAQLAHAEVGETAHQRLDLVERHARRGIETMILRHAIGRHAVRAAEIAGLDHRQAQVAQRAPERVAGQGLEAWSGVLVQDGVHGSSTAGVSGAFNPITSPGFATR